MLKQAVLFLTKYKETPLTTERKFRSRLIHEFNQSVIIQMDEFMN